MNIDGAIAKFETDEDAKKAGYRTLLTPVEAEHLGMMNRHERRAELARIRREARKKSRRK